MASYLEAATAQVCSTIDRHIQVIDKVGRNVFAHCVTAGYDGKNAVFGLWRLHDFFEEDCPKPLLYIGYGPDESKQYDGPEALTQNVLNKARICAQTGMDTLDIEHNPHHFFVAMGRYFPWGGAKVVRVGRVEFVAAVSGFTQQEDHVALGLIWKDICAILKSEVQDDLRRADLEKGDPERVKYPLGLVGRERNVSFGLAGGVRVGKIAVQATVEKGSDEVGSTPLTTTVLYGIRQDSEGTTADALDFRNGLPANNEVVVPEFAPAFDPNSVEQEVIERHRGSHGWVKGMGPRVPTADERTDIMGFSSPMIDPDVAAPAPGWDEARDSTTIQPQYFGD